MLDSLWFYRRAIGICSILDGIILLTPLSLFIKPDCTFMLMIWHSRKRNKQWQTERVEKMPWEEQANDVAETYKEITG